MNVCNNKFFFIIVSSSDEDFQLDPFGEAVLSNLKEAWKKYNKEIESLKKENDEQTEEIKLLKQQKVKHLIYIYIP